MVTCDGDRVTPVRHPSHPESRSGGAFISVLGLQFGTIRKIAPAVSSRTTKRASERGDKLLFAPV